MIELLLETGKKGIIPEVYDNVLLGYYKGFTWSKYGQKMAVWRCEDRLKNAEQAPDAKLPHLEGRRAPR